MSGRRKFAAVAQWGAVVALCLGAFQGQALAKLRAIQPWEEASPDGQFLLVMIPVGEHYHPPDDVKATRAKYPCNGLYRDDKSRKILWSVDDYFFKGSVFFSPDGQSVVIADEGYSTSDFFTVSLLGAGRRPTVWSFAENVPFGYVKARFSCRFFEFRKGQFDQAALTYTVWSEAGEQFTFDARTGELRDVSSPWHRGVIEGLACLAVISAILAWWLIRRRQEVKEKGLPG